MPDFHICEADPGPDWVYEKLHDLDVAISFEQFDEDQTVSAEHVRLAHGDERNGLRGLLLAVAGPAPDDARLGRFGLPEAPPAPVDLLGSVEFTLPTSDNRHLLDDLWLQVRGDARRAGIGTALWREAFRIAGEQGRDTIVAWSQHVPATDPSAEVVTPSAGAGFLPLDGASRFALSLGLGLAQVERQSRLLLPVDPHRLAELRAEAETFALPGYEVISWIGQVPQEHLDHVAAMNELLSTDAPIGDVNWQPEHWDGERVRLNDERLHRTGFSAYTLALVAGAGEPAGLTRFYVEHETPERVDQGNTVVPAAHRGHRLGLLLKVVNLQSLAAAHPECRRVDTWNAGENRWMLAINTRLGFRLHSVHGAWQASTRAR